MEKHKQQDVMIVELTEQDLKDPVDLNGEFEVMIIDDGERKILVDLSAVKMMTSLMIGAIVSIHTVAYENVALLKFIGLSDKIKMLFRLLGIDKLIEMHYGRDAALEALGQTSSDA